MSTTKTRTRGNEPMGELTIKVPVRWIQFVEDYFAVTGTDRDAEMRGWVEAFLLTFIEDLDAKDRLRLVDKHRLTDICETPGWVREEAAAIEKPAAAVPPVSNNQIERAIEMLVKRPEFRADFISNGNAALTRGMKMLSNEELGELASMGAPA